MTVPSRVATEGYSILLEARSCRGCALLGFWVRTSRLDASLALNQLQTPFDPLESPTKIGDIIRSGYIDRVKGGEVMLDCTEAGLDAGETQAHLALDVVQLAVDSTEHFTG
jgi:hypothetical protein